MAYCISLKNVQIFGNSAGYLKCWEGQNVPTISPPSKKKFSFLSIAEESIAHFNDRLPTSGLSEYFTG